MNARVHSAGHLLDIVMGQHGLNLEPSKGFHSPKGSYVEYVGKIPAEERQDLIISINKHCSKIIRETPE